MDKGILDIDFVRNILTISILLIVILLLVNFFSTEFRIMEILASWILSLVNFVFGMKIFVYSLDKPNKKFMTFSMGSIIIRLLINIIIVIVLITVFKLQKNYFILSFMVFYFIYLIFEIYILNKFSGKTKES